MEHFTRNGIRAGVAGGILLAAGATIQVFSGDESMSQEVTTAPFTTASILRFVGAFLMTWGVIAIYARQGDRAGRFGLVAVVACMANLLLQSCWMYLDLFVAPALAGPAPQILDGDTPGRLTIAFLLSWFANAAFILLGITTIRNGVLPRLCGAALIVTGLVTLLPLPVDGPVYEVIIGLAFTTAALQARPATGRHPVRPPVGV